MDKKLRFQLQNEIREIAPLLDRIEAELAAGGADEMVTFRMRLALDELLTNTVSYGFPDGGVHRIGVALDLGADSLVCELSDPGVPFDPFDAPAAVTEGDVEDRPIGGLGVHMVRQLIPELSYRYADGRNIVRLGSPLRLEPASL